MLLCFEEMRMKICFTLGAAALCALSFGQFSDNFESETGSAGGTIATGQNGWYLPVTGSLDGNIYTYGGNSFGMVANPSGNNQFLGGQSTGAAFVRAQHTVNFSSSTFYTISLDFNGMFLGQPTTAANNLGSMSASRARVRTISRHFTRIALATPAPQLSTRNMASPKTLPVSRLVRHS